MGTTAKSFSWNTIMQFSFLGFQFLSTIVLTRFLEPSDYALLGMINIFLVLGNLFVDSGISGAIIYKQSVEDIDYSTMFIFNFLVSLFIYVLIFVLAKPIASFYDTPVLIPVIRLAMLVVILHAFYTIPNTLLTKRLDFKYLTIANVVSGFMSFLTALLFAYKGYGVWALIAQSLSQSAFLIVLLNSYTKYYPSLKFSYSSLKEQLSFGLNCVSASIFRLLSDNLLTNFIAKNKDYTTTGYYVQSTRFHTPFVSLITSVMDRTLFPLLSKIDNREIQDVKINFFTRVMVVISLILTPMLMLVAPSGITFLLGEKWSSVGLYFNILVLATPAYVFQSCIRNALKSIGNTKQIFINDIVRFILIILLIFVSYGNSVELIAQLLVCVQYLLAVYLYLIIIKKISFKSKELLKQLLIGCISSLVPFAIISNYNFDTTFIKSLLLSVIYAICCIISMVVLKSEISSQIIKYIKNVWKNN